MGGREWGRREREEVRGGREAEEEYESVGVRAK